ncbi:MAG: phosphoenolpyruvate carboxykinase (ATP) [Actinobacteria bacterium]|nr:MAG: phosphoenolpyruvate carboxykinase (ATP) [Actinomycetota bacterium]
MRARKIHDNPSPEELRAFTEEMPSCKLTAFGNVNVQTRVTSRSTSATFIVADDPGITDQKTLTRAEYDRISALQDDYIAGREILVVDGYIGNVPGFAIPARLSIERANANIAGMQQKLYYPREGGEPQVHVIDTPNLSMPGYPEDRCIAVDLEHGVTRVIGSDYFGARRLQVRARRRARKGLPHHRAVGDRQDDHDVHDAERFPPRPGRLHRAHAGGQGPRHRERMLREDVLARPRLRAEHLPGRDEQGLVPGERLPGRRRFGELLRDELHEERPGRVLLGRPRAVQGRGLAPERRLAPDPELEREHHPGGREARPGAGGGVLHARGDDGHLGRRQGRGREVPAGPRHESVLPASPWPAGQPLPRAPGRAPDGGLPHEHGACRGQVRRRPLEEGEDPDLLGHRQGDRRGHDQLGGGPRLRLSRRLGGPRGGRLGAAPAPPALRAAVAAGRVHGLRRTIEARARRDAHDVPGPRARDRARRLVAGLTGRSPRRSRPGTCRSGRAATRRRTACRPPRVAPGCPTRSP